MQVIHELLIQSPEFASIGPHQFHVHVYGRVNVPADAASRAMVPLLHSVTHQLGIVAVQIPLPERALAFLNRALDAIQAAQMDEHPVSTPTRQVLDVAPQDLSEDDEVEWLQTLSDAPQVDAPRVLLADDDIFGYDSESEDLDGEDLDGDYYGDYWRIPGEYRRIPWNRDTQDMVGNEALARDDIVWEQPVPDIHHVWEQPVPDIHHDSPPAVSLPRDQSQEELDRMHHLVQHTLEQKINHYNSNLRRPFVLFRLRKWEKRKRVSQVHSSLLVGVVRRRFGVLLVVQIWHISVLPPRDLALHLFGNQRLCHNQS
jgi:hypothetical protein